MLKLMLDYGQPTGKNNTLVEQEGRGTFFLEEDLCSVELKGREGFDRKFGEDDVTVADG